MLAGVAVANACLAGGVAVAHDPSQHKTKAHHGTVTQADENSVTVATDGGETTFVIEPETKILRNGKSLTSQEIARGTRVEVYSTKLPGGKVAASEINLAADPRDGTDRSASAHHVHGGTGDHVR